MERSNASYEEVKQFLDQLRNWLTFFAGNVFYEFRPKNEQFMADMEWYKPAQKTEWLLKLEPEDYFKGPNDNEKPGLPPVWIFGKRIKEKLCYIKIHFLAKPNIYCISFHFAEHDMYLPLKGITEYI